MTIKQISVFLENSLGRLAEVTAVIGESGVNLRAASVADTADFGILRLVVDNPDRAISVLEAAGFTAKVTEVFGVELDDSPGGLARVMQIFDENGVNIEYLYTSLEHKSEKVVIIFRVEDTKHCAGIIKKQGLKTVDCF
jgi:hypothetical protein